MRRLSPPPSPAHDSRVTGAEVMRFTDAGLGNDSYLVVAGAAAVAVDPFRDVRPYLHAAAEREVSILGTAETHLHADFVSGARELAARGAAVFAGARADLAFPHRRVHDGDRIEVDGIVLTALATPGHAPEHVAYLLEGAGPPVLFTGGALMPGGAARTDLLGEERTVELARELYRTLHRRLAGLPDETVVNPTHGAGSFCSAAPTGGQRSTTLGRERRANPLLQATSEAEFVEILVAGYGLYPAYFRRLREVNRAGPRLVERPPSPRRMSAGEFAAQLDAGAWPIDVREPRRYAQRHLRESVHIVVGDTFAVRLGWVVPWGSRLVLVAESQREADLAATKAAGIGFDDVGGWAPIASLRRAAMPMASLEWLEPEELAARLESGERPALLDVRRPEEAAAGVIPGARNVEFGALAEGIPPAARKGPVVTYCQTGPRATLAASLLERAGVGPLGVLPEGPRGWRAAGHDLTRP